MINCLSRSFEISVKLTLKCVPIQLAGNPAGKLTVLVPPTDYTNAVQSVVGIFTSPVPSVYTHSQSLTVTYQFMMVTNINQCETIFTQ